MTDRVSVYTMKYPKTQNHSIKAFIYVENLSSSS